jgi:uncharacterized protein
MRVVLDTTTLISAFISKQGYPYKALDLWFRREYTLVTSTWQIEEFQEVSRRDRIKPLVNSIEVGRFINLLRQKAIVLEELPEVSYSPDPKDNPILAAAIIAQAQYVVSGDKQDMLALEAVKGIPIITVREFVESLK